MATVAPAALMTIEQYLRTSYHPDRDFVDGVLEERNVGEYKHGTIQSELCFWFRSHRDEWNVLTVGEYRTRVAHTRVRIPDVAVISGDAPEEAVRLTPALLCIEILSPKDRLARTVEVMEDYLAMGVPNLWIIDPYERTAHTYSTAGLLKVTEDRLEIPNSPIFVHLPTLFAALDKRPGSPSV